jgi:8-oxo-dGTP pyrophosphatase MutT (NUDIX family)
LRKNERDEWELPGGRMENKEQPEQAVIRELKEELGFEVEIKEKIQESFYRVTETKTVKVIIYLCVLVAKIGDFELISERLFCVLFS